MPPEAPRTCAHRSPRKPPRPAPILPPTASAVFRDLEYSVHACPRQLLRDVPAIFPDAPACARVSALLIPVLQRSAVDLSSYGPAQSAEKDRLLPRFLAWASAVRRAVARRQPTAWTDVTDPASGAAHFGTPAACASDVDALVAARSFRTVDCGGCTVATHPRWGFAVYPAIMFTTASPDTIKAALHDVNASHAHDQTSRDERHPQ